MGELPGRDGWFDGPDEMGLLSQLTVRHVSRGNLAISKLLRKAED